MGNADIEYVQFAVDRQTCLLVKFTTIGISQVPNVFFANVIFFCRRSREWEVLVCDVTTRYIFMAAKIKTFRSRFWGSDFTSIAMTIEVQNMMEMLFYNKGSKICLLLEYLFSNCHQHYQRFHLISIGNIGKINFCKIVQC